MLNLDTVDPVAQLIDIAKYTKELPTKAVAYLFAHEQYILQLAAKDGISQPVAMACITRATSQVKSSTIANLGDKGLVVGKALASGQFKSVVHHGTMANRPVACKMYLAGHVEEYEREKAVMLDLPPHKNVVPLLAHYALTTEVHCGTLVFPFYPRVLSNHIVNMLYYSGLENIVASVGLDLLSAVKHLHDSNYVHCDVKPDNVVLDHAGVAVLIDLGSAVAVGGDVVEHTSNYSMGLHNGVASPLLDYRCVAVTLFQFRTGIVPISLTHLTDACAGYDTTFFSAISDMASLSTVDAIDETIAKIRDVFSIVSVDFVQVAQCGELKEEDDDDDDAGDHNIHSLGSMKSSMR
jgi:serine/threonine protein kinase